MGFLRQALTAESNPGILTAASITSVADWLPQYTNKDSKPCTASRFGSFRTRVNIQFRTLSIIVLDLCVPAPEPPT